MYLQIMKSVILSDRRRIIGIKCYMKGLRVMKLTEKLDRLMEERGISRNQLAILSGIPYTTIVGLYEKGYENVKLSTLLKLIAFFGCTLDYLAIDDVEENKEPATDEGDGLSDVQRLNIGLLMSLNHEEVDQARAYIQGIRDARKE